MEIHLVSISMVSIEMLAQHPTHGDIDTNYELVASECVKVAINIHDVKALHVRKAIKYVKVYYSSISYLM